MGMGIKKFALLHKLANVRVKKSNLWKFPQNCVPTGHIRKCPRSQQLHPQKSHPEAV
jgi:hypothetical protein